MPYFLAVDAGGTKTDYVLADETRVIAHARSGSIKRLRVSEAMANSNLLNALATLKEKSGLALAQVQTTCIGAAGSMVPVVADWLRDAFERHVGGRLLLIEDVEIALDAAFFGGAGVLVLAGTGSNIAGRSSDGYMHTAGGWGPALADYGSGYSLGRSALRESFRALDDGRDTSLIGEILDYWNLGSVTDLVEKANREPRPDFSQLAVVLNKCAEQGDETALRVVHQEATALAHLVDVVIERIRTRQGTPDWAPAVAFTGSIMEHLPIMRNAVVEQVLKRTPDARLMPGVVSPVDGALWRARQ
jgi:N-acetylglucosamine kinase-like BadF-type ATPase